MSQVHDPTERFAELVAARRADLPLDEAVLLVAAHALPDLDIAHERSRLDEIAAGVGDASIEALCHHLVDELGFGGDEGDYHDPRNSLLPSVLDRRRGIPLTLSVVALEVGRRRGIRVTGVGMPGHFLLGSEDGAQYVDLFSGGAVLDRRGCQRVFQRLHPDASWDDRFLEPTGGVAIVSRMLANLANSYRRAGDGPSLAWVLELRLHLPGATVRDRRELAVLLGSAGRYDEAATVLEATGAVRDRASAARLRARLN